LLYPITKNNTYEKSIKRLSILILFVSIIFSGCEKIKSLADVTFEAEFSTDLPVQIQPTSLKADINGTFFETATIDPLSDTEFAKYAEKIKKIEIIEATAEVITINPSPILLVTANLTASATNFTSAVWSFANESLTQGKQLTLGNENSQWTNLQKILDSKEVFNVTLQGQADVDEASFTVRVKYKTKITANPL
jgi:PBP1b-binding outer membrane lipoprotein LpoB